MKQKKQWTLAFILSEQFLEFIDSIPEAVIISNYAGTIVQVNSIALNKFDY